MVLSRCRNVMDSDGGKLEAESTGEMGHSQGSFAVSDNKLAEKLERTQKKNVLKHHY